MYIRHISPIDIIRKGRCTRVYVDGKFNREATITSITPAYLTVYDKLPLPIHYRGRFYATGRMSDGHTIMFLGKRKLYILMRFVEFIRIISRIPEFTDQMPVEDSDKKQQPEEEVEDEL